MKRILIMVVIVLIGGACQVYGAQYGPMRAASDANKGFTLGAGYTFLPDEWTIGITGAKNLRVVQNQGFVQGGASFWRFDLFVRGGISDFKAEGGYLFSDGEIEADAAPYVEGGASMVFYENKTFSVGPFMQGSYYDTYEDTYRGAGVDIATGLDVAGKEKVTIEPLWSFAGGLKFQLAMEGALLYFGPAYLYTDANYKSVFVADSGGTTRTKGDAETTNKLGGFAGVMWKLDEHYQLELEAQLKNDVSFGGVLSYRF